MSDATPRPPHRDPELGASDPNAPSPINPPSQIPMLAKVALLGLVAGAHAGAVELTSDNYDELVKSSGKSAFIKFLAPW